MEIRYFIDRVTGEPHIYNHNVSEDEVEDVLEERLEDRPAMGGARIAIGRSGSGRILKVIYRPEPTSGGIFVIAAYDLRGNQLRAHRRRMRRKRR